LTLSVISLESSGVIRVLKRQVFNLRRDSYQRDSKFRFDWMDQASEVRREPADRDGTICVAGPMEGCVRRSGQAVSVIESSQKSTKSSAAPLVPPSPGRFSTWPKRMCSPRVKPFPQPPS